MYTSDEQFEVDVAEREKSGKRVFVAKDGKEIIAHLEIGEDAENFVTELPQMKNR